MKLSMYQLCNINHVLQKFYTQELNGLLSYRLFKIGNTIAPTIKPVLDTLAKGNLTDEESKVIGEELVDINIEKIKESDLESLILTPQDINLLAPIIEGFVYNEEVKHGI